MITHYLKVAFRNLMKYKTQSIIGILGLALGFTCFTMSALWIRYELTYDDFHRDAERIFLTATDDEITSGKYSIYTPPALADYLKSTYHEVEEVAMYQNSPIYVMRNNRMEAIETLGVDSNFVEMMDIKVLDGTSQFMLPHNDNNEIAITHEGAQYLFGTTHVIGKTLIDEQRKREYRIGAIVSGWGNHSTMKYHLIKACPSNKNWESTSYVTLMKVSERTDIETLKKKMNDNFPKELISNRFTPDTGLRKFLVKPLTDIRHDNELAIYRESGITLRYVIYFAVIGVLIIVCALINYLTLFVERCRIRQRELALRKVHGASEGSLLFLLASDFMLTALLSFSLSMVFIELLMPLFSRYTGITTGEISIYTECMVCVAVVALASLIVAMIVISFFHRKSLQDIIRSSRGSASERLFRKCNIVLQLSVCIAFIFSTLVMQMQIHHLRHTEVGFSYEGRAAVSFWLNVDMNEWMEKIKALPMVTEVVTPIYWPLVSLVASTSSTINSWEGLETDLQKPLSLHDINAGREFFDFYDIRLLSGEWVNENTKPYHVMTMESTIRKMGWTPEEAIGKHIYHANRQVEPLTVIGVVKDCAFSSPSADVPDVIFSNTYYSKWNWSRSFILFKYQPGTWDECRRLIEEMHQAELPDRKLMLFSEEEQFNDFLKAEDTLATLLNFASCVCVLIAIFGIYSLITLACEQRRKEIAIRKVNGATVSIILRMFLREYLSLLVIAALIAFPIAYTVMKQWVETYNRQTDIGIWPFMLVLVIMVLIIMISISNRVWKAANENPAEVVKSE